MEKEQVTRNLLLFSAYLLVVWGFYRLLFQLPEPFEDLLSKPLILLGAVAIFLKRESLNLNQIGLSIKNIFFASYISIFLAIPALFCGFLIVVLKYRGVVPAVSYSNSSVIFAFLLSFISALSEEIALRGYLLNRLKTYWSELKSVLCVSLLGVLLYVPLTALDWKMKLTSFVYALLLIFVFNFVSSFLASRTKSVLSSVIVHTFWIFPILFFR